MRPRPTLPFPITERAIQRLWSEGRIRFPSQTASGAKLECVSPGEWNRLGGPDFLGAELRLDGLRVRGDIEIELHPRDWSAHGHRRNPAFSGVILHATLFGPAQKVRTSSGAIPESLVLLPLLPEDLESAAEHDALMELRGRVPEIERLIRAANPNLESDLCRRASERYATKQYHLLKRVGSEGWLTTCHRATVEALGHGGNRGPMAQLGQLFGPEIFIQHEPEDLYLMQTGHWRLRGIRPAGHPHRRLAAYLNLCRERPNWMLNLRLWLEEVKQGRASRAGLIDGILGGLLPEALADTLVTDAWLPLAPDPLTEAWLEWPAGLRPDDLDAARLRLGIEGRARNWMIQGMLHTLGRTGKS